jgi:hypothetical protein
MSGGLWRRPPRPFAIPLGPHSARTQMSVARALKVAQTDPTPAPQGNLRSLARQGSLSS